MGIQKPAPVVAFGQKNGAGSSGVHIVSQGDTLYSISQRYRLPMRDIAVVNNMQAPFILRDGQRLKLPPPQEYTVREGDTLYSISRVFGVNSNEISSLNNLHQPYTLKVGQVLRLPSLTRKTLVAQHSESARVASVTRQSLQAPQGGDAGTQMASVQGRNVPLPPQKGGSLVKGASGGGSTSGSSAIKTATPKRSSSKFLRPVDGKIISDYGAKKNGLHNDGINIDAPRGTSIKAAENGVVVYAGNELKGSGNLVLVRHDGGWMTAYAHMEHIGVRKGQVVKRGEELGRVGSSGAVSRPQLHFEVRRGTEAMNPKRYLD